MCQPHTRTAHPAASRGQKPFTDRHGGLKSPLHAMSPQERSREVPGSTPSALPALPCRPPPSWPCTCRERSSARPGVGHRCRDQSSPPAGEERGAGYLHTAAGQPPPLWCTPTSAHQLAGTGCGARAAPGITPGKSLSPRIPRLSPRAGADPRDGTDGTSVSCVPTGRHTAAVPSWGTRPRGTTGTALMGASSMPASGFAPPVPMEVGGCRGVLSDVPPPRFRGPHLAERRPLLLARLVEAVVVLAVRLEDVGGAQLVEGL